MKTFEKNYVGKGKQIAGMDIVKITCKLADIQKFAHEYEGEIYITLEVAKMKKPDNYGRTHTAYVSQKVESENEATMVNEPKRKPRKQKANA